MKRLTSDNTFEMSMTELALNQVFVRDGWAWYRKAPEDECSVCDLIRGAAAKGLREECIYLDPNLTDEELGDVMLDLLQFGEEEPEGVLAILYRALWAMAEVRERLKLYEDMLFAKDSAELITPERLQEVRTWLKNDPLTPEQLRAMDRQPVWITPKVNPGRWDLIRRTTTSGMSTYTLGFLSWQDLGRTWLAYRGRK
ncbi:MAG: hypothetical protein K2L38_03440 [Dysosmobacter sp.]|nr:hypothetical protein [Dysosmobacter sp.]